jgi:uncharacterized membrane protein YkoI
MKDKLKGVVIAVVAIAALGVGGAAIAGAAGGGDDGDGKPITGPDLDRASAVALNEAGGGKVTGSEVQDEEGYYEIEVTRPDGKQVDVHLDKSFHVIASKADHEDGGGSKDD